MIFKEKKEKKGIVATENFRRQGSCQGAMRRVHIIYADKRMAHPALPR